MFALKKEWRKLPRISKSRGSSQDDSGGVSGSIGGGGGGAASVSSSVAGGDMSRDGQSPGGAGHDDDDLDDEDPDIAKIKKVQSFFRGWLCRRRWKQIVEEYIRNGERSRIHM
jgi:hypothetical protein